MSESPERVDLTARENASPATRERWFAAAWGFAEATFFFIVPDVLLTRIALQASLRRTLQCLLCAVAAAVAGGALVWALAASGRYQSLFHTYELLPGVHRGLIVATGQHIAADGPAALLDAGFTGRPYKLYAVHAGVQGVPLVTFIGWSAVSRAVRFFLMVLAAWAAGRVLTRWLEPKAVRQLHLLLWASFYAAYFWVMR